MKKLIIAVFMLFLLAAVSCKKEVPTQTNDCQGDSCDTLVWKMPSTVGSYWIYEWFTVDSNGVSTSINEFDTLRITGDTVVRGHSYAKYVGTTYPYQWITTNYLRDSSGYVVDYQGGIKYSMIPSGEVLAVLNGQMNDYVTEVGTFLESRTVPAGNFETIAKYIWVSNPDGSPINTCGDLAFNLGEFYSPTIGLIARRTAYISELQSWCQYREGRLIEYYISP